MTRRPYTWDCNPHPFGVGKAAQHFPGSMEMLDRQLPRGRWCVPRNWMPKEFRRTYDLKRMKFIVGRMNPNGIMYHLMGTYDGRAWTLSRRRHPIDGLRGHADIMLSPQRPRPVRS